MHQALLQRCLAFMACMVTIIARLDFTVVLAAYVIAHITGWDCILGCNCTAWGMAQHSVVAGKGTF